MSSQIFCLIMAGGKGTRLWPKSTEQFPKQYLKLVGDQALLKSTIDRLAQIAPQGNLSIVTTREQKALAEKEHGQIIIEPVGRNTAPCIYLSLMDLRAQGAVGEDIICIFPSDHYIGDLGPFAKAIEEAIDQARSCDHLVIVGITPTAPHTGYGHIKKGANGRVAAFKEKPPLPLAQEYFASGQYLWNAGIFLGKWQSFYDHYRKFLPDYLKVSNPRDCYENLKAISFDYAILEKTQKLLYVEGHFNWSDIGEWKALEKIFSGKGENVVLGKGQVTSVDSKGNIVWDDEGHVALVGVSGLVVVHHEGRLLVMDKEKSQQIKELHKILKSNDSLKHLL